MKNTLRKSLVLIFAFFALIAFSLGFTAGNAKADVEQAPSAPVGTKVEQLTEKVTLNSFSVTAKQIRTIAPYGMRFISSISNDDLANLPSDAEFGTLIIPNDMLSGDLTVDTEYAAKIKAYVGYNGDGVAVGYQGYTGVIVGDDVNTAFPDYDYGREFAAVGYVKYTYYNNGTPTTDIVYTDLATARLGEIADTVLPLTDAVDEPEAHETYTAIVNKVTENLTVTANNTAVRTGEEIGYTVSGVLDNCPITINVAGTIVAVKEKVAYGAKVGSGVLTATVVSTSKAVTSQEVSVSAIVVENDYFDYVEFRDVVDGVRVENDGALDFTSVNDALINKAVATSGISVTTLKVDNVAVANLPTISNGKIIFTATNAASDSLYGAHDFVLVLTDSAVGIDYTIEYTTGVADFVVMDKTDFDNMKAVATTTTEKVFDGYIMLGANIDYNGTFTNQISGRSDYGGDGSTGFFGTIDGNGHFVNGMTIGDGGWSKGLIGNLVGTIKNIAFVNALLINGGAYCGYLASTSYGGTIQDVMVSGYIDKNGGSAGHIPSFTVGAYSGTYTCKNFVGIIERGPTTETYTVGVTPIQFNTYGLGTTALSASTFDNCIMATWKTTSVGAVANGVTVIGVHTGLAIGAGLAWDDMVNWNSRCWTASSIDGSRIPDTYTRSYLMFKGCAEYIDLKTMYSGYMGTLNARYTA